MGVLYASSFTRLHLARRHVVSGLLALLAGLLLGWSQFGGLIESVLYLWHRHVLPAFYALHASGLTFCF